MVKKLNNNVLCYLLCIITMKQGSIQKFQEKEDSGFEVSEEGEIPAHEVSDADSDAQEYLKQQQSASDDEMQRRSHETESRLLQTVKKLRSYTICFV